jgi:hypothetical protein
MTINASLNVPIGMHMRRSEMLQGPVPLTPLCKRGYDVVERLELREAAV